MTASVLAQTSADFWRWVPHPEVWLLVGGLAGLYTYAVRVIAPKALPVGEPPASRRQVGCFVAGIALLWMAADWPVHDIGEKYLYLVHMSQHLVLTLVMPPLLLLATPEWLARLVVGTGRADRWLHKLARPIPAAVLFNGLALLTHAQFMVNGASENGLFHYGVHTAIVFTAFLLWIPVCGPFPELRISMPAQMLYLFSTSIVPTVPGAWLTFADGAVYRVYDIPQRLGGISVTSDQQVAGLIMKLVGGTYLWLLIAVIFFTWANRHHEADRRGETLSERDVLTWDEVKAELESTPAPIER
ncbi:MAG: cytochrome c oxidase assembly protein [Acidimicrobiales bacterium]|nr:cytochrome c oxidase assembly protein [Acidimicrobiales bacterium]